MPLATLARKNGGINASSIVPNSKSEFLSVITNFNFDSASFSMPEDISESL